jgi:hypothetical protein
MGERDLLKGLGAWRNGQFAAVKKQGSKCSSILTHSLKEERREGRTARRHGSYAQHHIR